MSKRLLTGTVSFIVLSVLLIASYLVIFQRYTITDNLAMIGYEPPAEIVALADNSSMSNEGRKLFYVNRPELNDKSSFTSNCPIRESSIVLGCYTGTRIHVLRVSDERLNGIEEVTAAHEMLHAVYERLDTKEREELDATLLAQYNSLTDERIKKTVEAYRAQDPSVVPNELHSILGTEVRQLNNNLESHYTKYFVSRGKVVDLAEGYQTIFTKYETEVANFDATLSQLKTQIEASQSSLQSESVAINDDRRRLDQLLNSGDVEAYNSSVQSFNARIERYNASVRTYQQLIARFNTLVEQRNASAIAERDLIQGLDASYQPITGRQ